MKSLCNWHKMFELLTTTIICLFFRSNIINILSLFALFILAPLSKSTNRIAAHARNTTLFPVFSPRKFKMIQRIRCMHFLSMHGIFLNQLILRLGRLNILNLTQRMHTYMSVLNRPGSFKRFCVHVLLCVSYIGWNVVKNIKNLTMPKVSRLSQVCNLFRCLSPFLSHQCKLAYINNANAELTNYFPQSLHILNRYHITFLNDVIKIVSVSSVEKYIQVYIY